MCSYVLNLLISKKFLATRHSLSLFRTSNHVNHLNIFISKDQLTMSFKIINQCHLFRNNRITKNLFFKRFILTPAYYCNEDWNKRLDEPLIKDIELDTFFYQLNEKLSKKISIRAADVDLYLNKSTSKNLSEVLNVMPRFRKNWRSHTMLESTHHAFVRIMLELKDLNKLSEILSKRIEFGIFPDKYCYNFILDAMVEAGQYENATKVALLRMLQEDFESTIGNYLSLKAIHTYMKGEIKPEIFANPVVTEDEVQKEEEDEDEDEVEYVRVPYLRNPFFDDHFDLQDTYSLVGKTYYLIGNAIENGELRDNCILYGLILYKKWDKAFEFLSSNIRLSKDLVEHVERFVSTFEDEKANQMVDKLKAIKNVSDKTLEQSIEDAVSTIGQLEADEISELKKLYEKFSKDRELRMQEDMDDLLKMEIIDQIKEKKKEFEDRKLKLYFFENYERLQVLEEDAKARIKKAEESMNIEEEYIPPKISR